MQGGSPLESGFRRVRAEHLLAVGTFLGDELREHAPYALVLRLLRGGRVDALVLRGHQLSLRPHGRRIEGPPKPQRAVSQQALHVLAAHERQMLSEAGAVHGPEPAALPRLLCPHPREPFGLARMRVRQAVDVVGVDPGAVLLERDRKGEQLPVTKAGKATHGIGLPSTDCAGTCPAPDGNAWPEDTMTTREVLLRAADLAVRFLDGVGDRPVGPPVDADRLRAALGGPLPEKGEDPRAVVEALARGVRLGGERAQPISHLVRHGH